MKWLTRRNPSVLSGPVGRLSPLRGGFGFGCIPLQTTSCWLHSSFDLNGDRKPHAGDLFHPERAAPVVQSHFPRHAKVQHPSQRTRCTTNVNHSNPVAPPVLLTPAPVGTDGLFCNDFPFKWMNPIATGFRKKLRSDRLRLIARLISAMNKIFVLLSKGGSCESTRPVRRVVRPAVA